MMNFGSLEMATASVMTMHAMYSVCLVTYTPTPGGLVADKRYKNVCDGDNFSCSDLSRHTSDRLP